MRSMPQQHLGTREHVNAYRNTHQEESHEGEAGETRAQTHFRSLQLTCPAASWEAGAGGRLVAVRRREWEAAVKLRREPQARPPARSLAARFRHVLETGLEPAISSLGGRRLIH